MKVPRPDLNNFVIHEVTTDPGQLEAVRRLMREYADELAVDLCFQGFEAELASLPGKYGPPRGALLLVTQGDEAVAIAALRPFDDRSGELKRFYVRPELRGQGLARALLHRLVAASQRIGFEELVLDTLTRLQPAIALYHSEGFVECESYYPNPEPDVVYMRRILVASSDAS